MSHLELLTNWIYNKARDFKEGLDLLKGLDSKYTTFFRENENAKQGSYAFNLLDARVARQIRILSQASKKKDSETIITTTEEPPQPNLKEISEAEIKKLKSLAKSAQMRADKAMEKAEKEKDPKKKKTLEEKAISAMEKAENAWLIAEEAEKNQKE